ncbi:MAG: M28 family peptidase, partial [Mucilaginibacter sp.]
GFTSTCAIRISGTGVKTVDLKNVMSYVKGTDPKLRNQYILLSSHYDHLGVAKEPKMEEGKLDSIYNGARDNATGTTAVIDAARYFAKYPPKRSVLFITYTAEEAGLIGSAYYVLHPLVPLNKTVYNLNIDNASYNDTTLVTLVALGRTSEDSVIIKAVKIYGMHVNNDPTGGALFMGSDNYPLAEKGVPAPTYGLGMKTFDSEIRKRYHRLSDETGNMDMAYVMKFIQAYILAAKGIADEPMQPRWTKGDPLEAKWKQLFGTVDVK